jgi:hypothetical protein
MLTRYGHLPRAGRERSVNDSDLASAFRPWHSHPVRLGGVLGRSPGGGAPRWRTAGTSPLRKKWEPRAGSPLSKPLAAERPSRYTGVTLRPGSSPG